MPCNPTLFTRTQSTLTDVILHILRRRHRPKEGKHASLAADLSVTQFSHLTKLLLWHGRNSYRRSAKLAQFVIHRGLVISVMQAVFSSIFYFAPIALYQGWLMVGYATIYTMAPVFSLVLDRDLNEDLALSYPEL